MNNNYETIHVKTTRNILVITLNRPERLNAVNQKMCEEIDRCLENADADATINAIIIIGEGRAFCTGVDLKEVSELNDPSEFVYPKSGFAGIVQATVKKPLIAAVNGMAYGGGCEIALACDLMIAANTSTFALPEVKWGIVASAGGLLRLPRQIPVKHAMEMALTGSVKTAQELEDWGLINEVVDQEDLLSTALSFAERITENAPLAIQASKEIILEGVELSMDDAWKLNYKVASKVLKTKDALEGPRAFAEKRHPYWVGE